MEPSVLSGYSKLQAHILRTIRQHGIAFGAPSALRRTQSCYRRFPLASKLYHQRQWQMKEMMCLEATGEWASVQHARAPLGQEGVFLVFRRGFYVHDYMCMIT